MSVFPNQNQYQPYNPFQPYSPSFYPFGQYFLSSGTTNPMLSAPAQGTMSNPASLAPYSAQAWYQFLPQQGSPFANLFGGRGLFPQWDPFMMQYMFSQMGPRQAPTVPVPGGIGQDAPFPTTGPGQVLAPARPAERDRMLSEPTAPSAPSAPEALPGSGGPGPEPGLQPPGGTVTA